MKILLTNDDGINAKGIYVLARELSMYNEVTVIAPSLQKSACGHSITIDRPVIVKEEELKGLKVKAYSLSGTPADCVRIGMDKIIDGNIDMVVSGINRGLNVGTDVIYSGTVSAAIESAIYGIPSLAVSQEINKDEEENYDIAAKYALKVLDIFKNKPLGEDVVLNLNVPIAKEEEIEGIKVCKIGKTRYEHAYLEYMSEKDERGYNIKGEMLSKDFNEDDVDYIKQKYVTLTPLHFDLTNFNILKEVNKIMKNH